MAIPTVKRNPKDKVLVIPARWPHPSEQKPPGGMTPPPSQKK